MKTTVPDPDLPPRALEIIQAAFPIEPVPTVPEIRLHKAGPKSGIWRLAELDARHFGNPYWAHYWGGGLALARHILDHPETVVGRNALDLGAGSGLVGIAAAKAGARKVISADIDRYAVAAVRLNAAANHVRVSTFLGDLTGGPAPTVDVVLVGDLFYEKSLAERVTAFLDRCLEAGVEALIGDPQRAFLPRSRLRMLAEYPGPDFGDGANGRLQRNAVFSFEPARRILAPDCSTTPPRPILPRPPFP